MRKLANHPRHWKMAASATRDAVVRTTYQAYFQCFLEKKTNAKKLAAISERKVIDPPPRTGLPQKLKFGSRENTEARKNMRNRPPKSKSPGFAPAIFCLMFWMIRERSCPSIKKKKNTRTREKRTLNTIDFPHSGGENQGGKLTRGRMRIRRHNPVKTLPMSMLRSICVYDIQVILVCLH